MSKSTLEQLDLVRGAKPRSTFLEEHLAKTLESTAEPGTQVSVPVRPCEACGKKFDCQNCRSFHIQDEQAKEILENKAFAKKYGGAFG